MSNLKQNAKLEAIKIISQMILDDTYSTEGIGLVLDRYAHQLDIIKISEQIDSISEGCTAKFKV
jgi:hypothetical protein